MIGRGVRSWGGKAAHEQFHPAGWYFMQQSGARPAPASGARAACSEVPRVNGEPLLLTPGYSRMKANRRTVVENELGFVLPVPS